MTLCCVWHSSDGWQLASDSRLTLSRDLTVDISVKVTSFRVRIPTASAAGLRGGSMRVDQEVGLAASGDLATTYPTRESLRAVMSWLWVNPSVPHELSMLQFTNAAGDVLLRLWTKRSEMEVEEIRATVAIVGWCPKERRGRAFLMTPEISGDTARMSVRELQAGEPPCYYGSGATEARRTSEERPSLTPPQVIRQVSRSQQVPSVGGRVQYGKLVEKDFCVCTVFDFDLDEHDKTLRGGYFIGGVELMADDQKLRLPEGYTLLPNYGVAPFQEEYDEAVRRGFRPIMNYAHFPNLIGGA